MEEFIVFFVVVFFFKWWILMDFVGMFGFLVLNSMDCH